MVEHKQKPEVRSCVDAAIAVTRVDLAERHAVAAAMLRNCHMCELHCGVDRVAGQHGRCRLGTGSRSYKLYVSLNEELELVPALRVFVGGCNFRCPWCDEASQAFEGRGQVLAPETWATMLAPALREGVRAVSLLGGEPSVQVHAVLSLAAAIRGGLPLALNTNMYMTPEVLRLLDGVVLWYLADFKFGNDACAQRLAGVPHYTEVVRRNLAWVAGRARLVVRHLLMPGHLGCCFQTVASWAAEHLPGARFQLYPGYIPCGPAACDPEIGRLNTRAEVHAADGYLARLNLRRTSADVVAMLEARTRAGPTHRPAFGGTGSTDAPGAPPGTAGPSPETGTGS